MITREVVEQQSTHSKDSTYETVVSADSGIRDVGGLVKAVVDLVFRVEETEFPDENSFLQSLDDLKRLLSSILEKALDPLNNPEAEKFLEETDFAVPDDDASQGAVENISNDRFRPVIV